MTIGGKVGKKVKHVLFDKRMRQWAKRSHIEGETKEELLQDLWTSLAEMSQDPEQSRYFSELFRAIEKGDALEIRRLWDKVEAARRKARSTAGVVDFNGRFVCMFCIWDQAKRYGRPFSIREIVTWHDVAESGSREPRQCRKCGKTIGGDPEGTSGGP